MLTYYYALISNPCERTANALFEYLRAHAGCLHTLEPEDRRAIRRAIVVWLRPWIRGRSRRAHG